MDWFERLTGFQERGYEDTREKLYVEGAMLTSLVNQRSYGIGRLETVSLGELRRRAAERAGPRGRLKVGVVTGDVRAMHRAPANKGALFQVASQFNMLEMISERVTPEQGVTRYASDPTQGPACAIAAGAATIYRNYFAPVGSAVGQTATRQLDGLKDVGIALGEALGKQPSSLWRMQNGYALCTEAGASAIEEHLADLGKARLDDLRSALRIGLHEDVEVTDGGASAGPEQGHSVSQAFCSALPIPHNHEVSPSTWRSFPQLILEAAYEATLWAGVLNAQLGASNVVLLTRLGGGAFGNKDPWIKSAMERALAIVSDFALDVRIVCFGSPSSDVLATVRRFQ